MKPLTIEELKKLEVGDWVWILPIDKALCGYYAEILRQEKEALIYSAMCRGVQTIYSDYGKTWLAYKNKEQAETKGEIVELPCKVGDDIYYVVAIGENSEIVKTVVIHIGLYNHGIDIEAYQTNRHRFYNLDGQVIVDGLLLDKSEAKRRLKELKGERP